MHCASLRDFNAHACNFSGAAVAYMGQHCHQLSSLALNHCGGVTDGGLALLAPHSGTHTSLSLAHLPQLTDRWLGAAGTGWHCLEQLDLTPPSDDGPGRHPRDIGG